MMKKVLFSLMASTCLLFPFQSQAASEAIFTITSAKTNYSVGEDIQINLNVDAGSYATTLSVIDFDLKISDLSVVELRDRTQPFVPGNIYSTAGIQSFEGDIVNAVTYISPTNKPANRSGSIGTINFKALKEGRVTFSYDRIEAAEESKEDDYVTTSASSYTITVGSTVGSSSTGSSSSSAGYYSYTPTPTVKAATTTATDTTTGPEAVLLVAGAGGFSLFILRKLLARKGART